MTYDASSEPNEDGVGRHCELQHVRVCDLLEVGSCLLLGGRDEWGLGSGRCQVQRCAILIRIIDPGCRSASRFPNLGLRISCLLRVLCS
jgi:hypothetical protein